MSQLNLTPGEVRAVLDSMETNDHCTVAYNVEIQQVREKLAAFAGDGGLVLRRPATNVFEVASVVEGRRAYL